MIRTCYLHIGAPQAGTGAIQRFLMRNKRVLLTNGIMFPGRRHRHDFILNALASDPLALPFNAAFKANPDGLRKIILRDRAFVESELTRRPATDFVISNERFLTYAPQIDIAGLLGYLRTYASTIKLVICVRDPIAAMLRNAQQSITDDMATYESVASDPPLMDIRNAEALIEAVGRDNVIALPVRDGASIVQSFAQAIGVRDRAIANAVADTRIDRALPLEGAMLAGKLNALRRHAPRKVSRVDASALRSVGRTPFALPLASLRRRWLDLQQQYRFIEEQLGVRFDRPDIEKAPEPKAVWDDATLQDIAELLIGQTLRARKDVRVALKRRAAKRAKGEAATKAKAAGPVPPQAAASVPPKIKVKAKA